MPKLILDEDVFAALLSWCFSGREGANLWIALCLSKGGIISSHCEAWEQGFRGMLLARRVDYASTLMRMGIRFDTKGIRLLKCFHQMRKCSRSGCSVRYREEHNLVGVCSYHPGKLRAKVLSCCKEPSFQSPGCKLAFHEGSIFEAIYSSREEEEVKEGGL